MKKKFLLAISLVAIMTVLFAISVSAVDPKESWDISQNGDGSVMAYLYEDTEKEGYYTMTISGTGNMKGWTASPYAPWYSLYASLIKHVVIEDGVTSIGDAAFYGCGSLTSVIIPQSVKSIGIGAFLECENLSGVNLPVALTDLGRGAFCGCIAIESIVVPEGITAIHDYTFMGCINLKSVVLPKGITTIGSCAFDFCMSLERITAFQSVESIGDFAFAYCENLEAIILPKSVINIDTSAFYNCTSLTIYCEATNKPSGWSSLWNDSNCPVVWGYFDEESCLEKVFTFKGYSFGFAGQISVGFDIDYEAKAKYEEKTGKTLEIGVLFAGYDNLGGKQPLDANGNAITLDIGKVIKGDLTSFNYPSYDFMLTDVDDSIKDVKLVIAAYIYSGEDIKYEQENGLSDIVSGISYNEAKESVEK